MPWTSGAVLRGGGRGDGRGGGRGGGGGGVEKPKPFHEQITIEAPACSKVGIQPWVKRGVDWVEPRGESSRNKVRWVMTEEDLQGFIHAFGTDHMLPCNTFITLEPTEDNCYVCEADCNLGKSTAILTWLYRLLLKNPDMPFVFFSVRVSHAKDLFKTIRDFKPRGEEALPTIGELCPRFMCYKENNAAACQSSNQLVCSGESIGKLGDVTRFRSGVGLWDEFFDHSLILGARDSGTVGDTGDLARTYERVCNVVKFRVFAGRDITLNHIPTRCLELIAPAFDVLHVQCSGVGQRNAFRYAFDCKEENKEMRGKVIALARFHLDVLAVIDSFKSPNEADWARLWVAVGSKKYFKKHLQPILEQLLSPDQWEFYWADSNQEMKARDFSDTATYLKNKRIIISTTTIEVAINVDVKILRRWLFTYQGDRVSTAAELMQLIARVPRGSRERQQQMLVHHEIYVLFGGSAPDKEQCDQVVSEKTVAAVNRDIVWTAGAARRSERADTRMASDLFGIHRQPEALSFSKAHNALRTEVRLYHEAHQGSKHIVRFLELAAKNRFEPLDAMQPLTEEERRALSHDRLGTTYEVDDEKAVNDMAGDMALLYPWFMQDISKREELIKRPSAHACLPMPLGWASLMRCELCSKVLHEFFTDCYGRADQKDRDGAVDKALRSVFFVLNKYTFYVDRNGSPASGSCATRRFVYPPEAIARAMVCKNQKLSPDVYETAKSPDEVRRLYSELDAKVREDTNTKLIEEHQLVCMLQRDAQAIARLAHVRHLDLSTIRALEGSRTLKVNNKNPHREQKTTVSQIAALVHDVAKHLSISVTTLTTHNGPASVATRFWAAQVAALNAQCPVTPSSLNALPMFS